MSELFNIEDVTPLFAPSIGSHPTCRTCQHRERWECNSKVFQYCGVRGSNKTANGKLKIKCKTPACGLYKEEIE